jgi:Tol biopolymer transport system component
MHSATATPQSTSHWFRDIRASLPARLRPLRAPARFIAFALIACDGSPQPSDPSGGLVFVRREGDGTELVRARLSDGRERALTNTPDREESWPYWSQAAGRLAFQGIERTHGEPGRSDLFLWNPETGAETPLGPTPARDERWPAWSPNGSSLIYAFRGGQPPAGLGMFELATGRKGVIAASQLRPYYLRPSFSPDGSRIVVQRRGADGTGSKLWIVERGVDPRPLTRDAAWFDMKAWFTRDGARVLYSRRPSDGGPYEIASVASDGSSVRTHASLSDSDDHSARPSPTRDEFVFVSDRTGNNEIYVSHFADGEPRRLTHTPDENEYAPRWSPDGERLVVITLDSRLGRPRLVETENLEHVRVRVLDRQGRVLFEATGYNAGWMPAW